MHGLTRMISTFYYSSIFPALQQMTCLKTMRALTIGKWFRAVDAIRCQGWST